MNDDTPTVTADPVDDAQVAGEAPGAPAPPQAPPREPPRRQRRRRRRRWVVLLVIAALALLPFVVAAGWFAWQLDPPGGAGDPVSVTIEPGWGAQEAGDALAAQSVIGSTVAFRVWVKLQGTSFQAGTYELRQDMGVRAAADALAAGPSASLTDQMRLLVPPGLSMSQIADRVGQLAGHTRDGFLAVAGSGVVRSKYQPAGVTSLEGLTWPDTYFVAESQSDEDILRTLVRAFDAHADAAGLGAPNSAGLTPYQVVITASLAQGESAAADYTTVAGVIVNRLRRGMPLQIDATLCYAKGGCPPVPTNADKQIDSPYNTYRVTGLPPTPILTVTEEALRAAAAPASHDYLFYVTGTDGVTRFSSTLAGHNENIREHGVRGE